VTRGSGGRGYVAPGSPQPRRIVAASPLPAYPAHWPGQGVTARLCSLRLSAQPRLAGVKHLNRLENVLARAEWNDPEIAEGLLMDETGNVIEGIRCNLFIIEDGTFLTPDLSRCGVAGVTRDLVMASATHHGFRCCSEAISRDRLQAADEVLLVNSLIGVWPVAVLEGRRWTGFKYAPRVRKWLDGFADPSR
jgi:4-amino-4-deoxychorismate lyase